ncbi:MBL fold metallo-hydrolase [Ensifer sp. 22564]|uniref:MBL fold metallo-hydrolase n=1 Tax=Ensifer sp. 22564 TaxID=3453943 RepID=UPI003F84AE95
MQQAKIVRTQHPVGHGGFHTGLITTTEIGAPHVGPPGNRAIGTFNYVYDCGSEQGEAFNAELALYREESGGSTDILFVSHLHADHINGIDRLQGMAPARRVVVPYLDVIERLLFVLREFERGAASHSSLDYFADPAAWWLGRGVQEVNFLQQGGPDDLPPPRGGEPDAPLDDPRDRRRVVRLEDRDKTKRPESRLNGHLRPPNGGDVEGLTPAGTKRQTQTGAFIAASGSYFQLEWRNSTGDLWRRGDWILLPYVHPVDDPARKRFVKDLKAAVGVRRSGNPDLTEALLSHLRSLEKVKRLVGIYQRHFPGGHNAISMSLYSGPLSQQAGSIASGRPSNGWSSSIGHLDYGPYFWRGDGIGWLGTGDAALLQDKWRKPWREFYEPFGDRVGIMTLPHHGSAHNFHPDILTFAAIRYALATTVEARNRVARMRETLGMVETRGIRTQVVDDLRHSRFRVICERTMA